MPALKLTEKFLEKLTSVDPDHPDLGPKPSRMVFDTTLKGLGVKVTAAGSKTFYVRWTDESGKSHRIAIPGGSWPAMRMDVAREKAFEILRDIRSKGRDPKAERKAARALKAAGGPLTVGSLIEAWEQHGLADRRPSYRRGAPAGLRRTLAHLLATPAADLTRRMVIALSEKLQADGRRSTASAMMAHLSAMYGWAAKTGRVESNPFLGAPRPAAGRSERVLSNAEIGAVYAAAGLRPYPSGPFIQLLLLTGVRLREAAEMEWAELDANLTTWTVPADRMKNGRGHVVHLSEPSRAILRKIQDEARLVNSKYVFTTTGSRPISGFSNIKDSLDAISGVTKWRLHDLRHTIATQLIDLGVSIDAADKILSHTMTGTKRLYQHNPLLAERREALDKWAALVTDLAERAMPAVAARATAAREEHRAMSSVRLKAVRAAQIEAAGRRAA